MDRFIEFSNFIKRVTSSNLKSNIDRFIVKTLKEIESSNRHLKSNMDRFIAVATFFA